MTLRERVGRVKKEKHMYRKVCVCVVVVQGAHSQQQQPWRETHRRITKSGWWVGVTFRQNFSNPSCPPRSCLVAWL